MLGTPSRDDMMENRELVSLKGKGERFRARITDSLSRGHPQAPSRPEQRLPAGPGSEPWSRLPALTQRDGPPAPS